MTVFERWSLIGVYAAIVVNIIAFLVVVWQLRLLAHQNRQGQQANTQDHDRRRKQATLEFFAAIHDKQIEFRKTMPNVWASVEIAALIENALNGDIAAEKNIIGYLNMYEHLAAGARTDIFDLDVINQLAGGWLILLERNYRPYIMHLRKIRGEFDVYGELEWQAKTLSKLRNLSN